MNQKFSLLGTTIYVRVTQFFSGMSSIALLSLGVFDLSSKSATMGLPAWGFICLGLATGMLTYALQKMLKGLEQRMKWAWVMALILSGLSLTSLVLAPFAIFSIICLVRPSTRKAMESGESPRFSLTNLKQTQCPRCAAELTEDRKIGKFYYCDCGWSNSIESYENTYSDLRNRAVSSYIGGLATLILVCVWLVGIGGNSNLLDEAQLIEGSHNEYVFDRILLEKYAEASVQTLRSKFQECHQANNMNCQMVMLRYLHLQQPENNVWASNLAFRLTKLGHHQQAIAIYGSLVSAVDITYDVYAYYGTSLQKLGDHNEAISAFAKALAINPRLADTTHDMASSLIYLGHLEQAYNLITEFVSRFPDSSDYFRDLLVNINSRVKSDARIFIHKKNSKSAY